MYNMYVLFDTQGRQKQKHSVVRKLVTYLCGAKSDFLLYFFNVISGSHTAYFSECVVIKHSIASFTVVITVVTV